MKQDFSSFEARKLYSDNSRVEDRVRRYLPLVKRSAWHIYGSGRDGLELDDLVQIGLYALVDCAKRHIGPGEDGFSAYAKTRVKGAMLDELRRLAPGSRTMMQRQRQLEEARTRLRQLLSREPSRAELAAELGLDDWELVKLECSKVQLSSIEDVSETNDPELADDTPGPFDHLAQIDDRNQLVGALSQLPERQQQILQLFYVEELNLTEIAEIFEVSVPRVHQIRAQALKKLKSLLDRPVDAPS